MSPSVQLLASTSTALREALRQRDWSVIGELDLKCRVAIDEAMVEPHPDDGLLRARMEELLSLYRDLVVTCQAERRRLASELIQLQQSQQGAKVYQLFG